MNTSNNPDWLNSAWLNTCEAEPMWTRGAETLNLLRSLEDHLKKYGYHCALSGGVLHTGYSMKNLGIIVYPHDTDACITPDEVWGKILEHFSSNLSSCGKCNEKYRDGKDVRWARTRDGKRIDFFFLK